MKVTFSIMLALQSVAISAFRRGSKLVSKLSMNLALILHWTFLSNFSVVRANYTGLTNDAKSNYDTFVNNQDADPTVFTDINDFLSSDLNWESFAARGHAIRHAGSQAFCVGNLSVALGSVGGAMSANMSSASSLLTIIPAAGVLIGAPAKELWVLYKLCPLGGVLSMLLSLGGNMVPGKTDDYQIDEFEYDTMMAAPAEEKKSERQEQEEADAKLTEAERFANKVLKRARGTTGTNPARKIYMSMVLQCVWIVVIIIACYLVAKGSIIPWWCEFGGWSYVWYGILSFSSLLENFAGVPFTTTWTIRVWRAPRVIVDPETPWVISPVREDWSSPTPQNGAATEDPATGRVAVLRKPVVSVGEVGFPLPSIHQPTSHDLRARESLAEPTDILAGLEKGYNTTGSVWLDPTVPWSAAIETFYVLLSVKGVTPAHALLRILSKLVSIGAFATGTGLFASTTLVTIERALVMLVLVLLSGLLGRVTAMYMASEMIRTEPVIHRVVKNREEAGKYLEAIFRQPEIACEVLGHVIVQGRCVKKFGKSLRWSGLLGVLARPYDLTRLATWRRGSRTRMPRAGAGGEYLMQPPEVERV